MIPNERLLQLAGEAQSVREKYRPQTAEDLEQIAREEYGVAHVVRTPLAKSQVIKERGSGNLFIFYNAFYEPYLPIVLGHEIGHIAALHLKTRSRNLRKEQKEIQEQEADYYAACLNDIPLATVQHFRSRDAFLSSFGKVRHLFQRELMRQEVDRLQKLGVYHWLE